MDLFRILIATMLLVSVKCFKTINISDTYSIMCMMERPAEYLFLPKGDNVHFFLPTDDVNPVYQGVAEGIEDRIGPDSNVTVVQVEDVQLPDMNMSLELPRHEHFSTFVPYHRRMASHCIEVLLGLSTRQQFARAAAALRDRMNPEMWVFCMQVVLIHRNDTQNIDVPGLNVVRPDKFLDGAVFRQAREDVTLLDSDERMPIEIPQDYTATDKDPEHQLAYFREDMGVNLHHWTWHLVYPFAGPISIIRKDRRGELFYYQHEQFVARYNFERFCVNLNRVLPINDFHEPIKEAYFPKLDSLVATRNWPGRMVGATLQDIDRPDLQLTYEIQDLERWTDRLMQAASEGRALSSNLSYVNLNTPQGIDTLGNMMEASLLNINPNLYGDLHNLGHIAISLVHDPDQRFLESFGVMGDLGTAMRDPTFYRWHKFVDNVFQTHKRTLQPYTTQELNFAAINVTSIDVVTNGFPNNQFNTFWQQSDVDLSRGLDLNPRGNVFARLTHLQHVPFSYRIQVTNGGAARTGTVRIFMSPKFDERGLPMQFGEQRLMFIELDRFYVNLRPGSNTIVRQSINSSVTIPYERTFRQLDQTQQTPSDQQFNYCGCGWPQHMLIPRGTPEGLDAELFVMVSNFADDVVPQPAPTGCSGAPSYCGWFNRLYPDRRPMGYPFDRSPRQGANTLARFLTSNMFVRDVTINFDERVEIRSAPSSTTTTPNNTRSG